MKSYCIHTKKAVLLEDSDPDSDLVLNRYDHTLTINHEHIHFVVAFPKSKSKIKKGIYEKKQKKGEQNIFWDVESPDPPEEGRCVDAGGEDSGVCVRACV